MVPDDNYIMYCGSAVFKLHNQYPVELTLKTEFSTENKFSIVPVDVYKSLSYANKNPQCPK